MLKFGGCSRLTWGRGPSDVRSGGNMGPRGRCAGYAPGHRVGGARSPTLRCGRHAAPAARASAHRALRRGGPDAASSARLGGWGASFGVTPRQACPRPGGLGRNLRSKTRWFAGFCNSHQVSHFATFFIDARAEISVAESRVDFIASQRGGRPAGAVRTPG